MNQEKFIEEFNKVSDIRMFLLNHPDSKMILDSCLHFLGNRVHELFYKRFIVEVHWNKNVTENTIQLHEISWKTVFNSNIKKWDDINDARKAAKNAGYSYFTWLTLIYHVDGGYPIDICVNELDNY